MTKQDRRQELDSLQPPTVGFIVLMSYAHSTAFHRDGAPASTIHHTYTHTHRLAFPAAFAGAARGPASGFVSGVQPVKRASLSEPNGEPNDAEVCRATSFARTIHPPPLPQIAEQVRVEMNRIAQMKKLGLSLADPRPVYASRQ